MAQQTAVDFLIEQLKPIINYSSLVLEINHIAKEMEKQQHEETALSIAEILLDKLEDKNNLSSKAAFEQYYTETYGK
jgi:hypothetical protein